MRCVMAAGWAAKLVMGTRELAGELAGSAGLGSRRGAGGMQAWLSLLVVLRVGPRLLLPEFVGAWAAQGCAGEVARGVRGWAQGGGASAALGPPVTIGGQKICSPSSCSCCCSGCSGWDWGFPRGADWPLPVGADGAAAAAALAGPQAAGWMGEGPGVEEPSLRPGGAAGEEQLLAATSWLYDVEGDATPPLKSPMHGCGTEGAAKVAPLFGLPRGAAWLMAGTDDLARVPAARPCCCWGGFWAQSGCCRWGSARRPGMSASRAKGDVGDELGDCASGQGAMCAVSARVGSSKASVLRERVLGPT